MNGTGELFAKYPIDKSLAVNPRLADKLARYHFNPEMTLTSFTRTDVPLMEMGFIHHHEILRFKTFF